MVRINSARRSSEMTQSKRPFKKASWMPRQLRLESNMPIDTFVSITALGIHFLARFAYALPNFFGRKRFSCRAGSEPMKKAAPALASGIPLKPLDERDFIVGG